MAVAELAMSLGCTSAQAASASEVMPACKLYLAMLSLSHSLAEPLKFCPPIEFEAEQGLRAVVAYVESSPGRAREDFTMLALEALRSKWPCR